MIVRVVVDVPAISRQFDYSIPEGSEARVVVGTMVRVPLHGRRVAGWVTELDVDAPDGVTIQPISKISGVGPSPEMIELCRWAAWRWAGRLPQFLSTASPLKMVPSIGSPRGGVRPAAASAVAAELFTRRRSVFRLPPAGDPLDVVVAAAALGDALVICPSVAQATMVARRLRATGVSVAMHPHDWARAAAGGATVVGARAAAFAPMPSLAAVVVLDESDEALQSEGSPTWHAREVVLERARRANVPAIMVSATPSLESTARSPLVTLDRATERAGWPVVEVLDRRDEDLVRTGLYSQTLVDRLRSASSAVCVLNRTGRSSLLACRTCGTITCCERCDSAVVMAGSDHLDCRRCGLRRPVICQACGAMAMKNLRVGVSRASEELAALLGEPVTEISGSTDDFRATRVMVGTEAILHRVRNTSTVAFLEFDQELMAPRYRAWEQALGLIARAGRLVGGRAGRVILQTRDPEHTVIRAAVAADPAILSVVEAARRELTGFPPARTVAVIGGAAAAEFVERLGAPLGVEIARGDGDHWLARSADRAVLLDALAAVDRPPGRLRLQIDPARLPDQHS